jgi:hypothetical protein
MKLTGIRQRGHRRTRWDRTRYSCMLLIRYLKGVPRFDGAETHSGSLSPSGNHDDGANGRMGAKPTITGVSRTAAFAHGPGFGNIELPREALLVASFIASVRIIRTALRASPIVGMRLPIVCMLTPVMLIALAVVGAAQATERTA